MKFFLRTIKNNCLCWEETSEDSFNQQKEMFHIIANNDKIAGFIGHAEYHGQMYSAAGMIKK
jgi:hypothetical protein